MYNIFSVRYSMVMWHDSVTLILSQWPDMTFLKTLLIHNANWYFFSQPIRWVCNKLNFFTSFYQSIKTLNIINQAKGRLAGNRPEKALLINKMALLIIIKCTCSIICFLNRFIHNCWVSESVLFLQSCSYIHVVYAPLILNILTHYFVYERKEFKVLYNLKK